MQQPTAQQRVRAAAYELVDRRQDSIGRPTNTAACVVWTVTVASAAALTIAAAVLHEGQQPLREERRIGTHQLSLLQRSPQMARPPETIALVHQVFHRPVLHQLRSTQFINAEICQVLRCAIRPLCKVAPT